MNLSGLSYFDYIYLVLLVLFAVFFGIKGATKSISYSLKIILSISLHLLAAISDQVASGSPASGKMFLFGNLVDPDLKGIKAILQPLTNYLHMFLPKQA